MDRERTGSCRFWVTAFVDVGEKAAVVHASGSDGAKVAKYRQQLGVILRPGAGTDFAP